MTSLFAQASGSGGISAVWLALIGSAGLIIGQLVSKMGTKRTATVSEAQVVVDAWKHVVEAKDQQIEDAWAAADRAEKSAAAAVLGERKCRQQMEDMAATHADEMASLRARIARLERNPEDRTRSGD